MTRSANVDPLRAPDAAAAVEHLRAAGLRTSTPRRLVIEALFDAEGPVSATHLSAALTLEESSVYRNLEVLEAHGLVRHLHLGHGPGLYVIASGNDAEYLYCEHCGKVAVVAPAELDAIREQIHDRFGIAAHFTHFAIVGVCDQCAAGRHAGGAGERSAAAPPDAEPARTLHSHGAFVHSHSHHGKHSHEHSG